MIKLAVVGNPVFHSLSPYVFSIFSENSPIIIKYNRISAPNIEDAFRFAKEMNLNGLNITSPFKYDVLEKLDKVDYQASNLNSSNTVKFFENSSIGFNTDYFGILMTIWDNNFILNKRKVLILGAGAAGRTAAFAVRNLNSFVYVWDRKELKAQKMSKEVGVKYIKTQDLLNDIDSFNYIISTIPYNSEILRKINFSSKNIIFDTIYHNSFFKENKEKFGYQLISGERWLINQAILSHEIFLGSKPTNLPSVQELEKVKQIKTNCYILIGFSGSGKTTIGKKIAQKLNAEFYDIDNLIEEQEKKTIADIFSQNGEIYFRQKENEILKVVSKNVSLQNRPVIISTGGGILTHQENINILKQLGFIIWMYSPIDALLERIELTKNRPMIKNNISASQLYDSRVEDYFLHSKAVFLNTSNEEEAVSRLFTEINRLL